MKYMNQTHLVLIVSEIRFKKLEEAYCSSKPIYLLHFKNERKKKKKNNKLKIIVPT